MVISLRTASDMSLIINFHILLGLVLNKYIKMIFVLIRSVYV